MNKLIIAFLALLFISSSAVRIAPLIVAGGIAAAKAIGLGAATAAGGEAYKAGSKKVSKLELSEEDDCRELLREFAQSDEDRLQVDERDVRERIHHCIDTLFGRQDQ
jgi:hypothetical protein